MTPFERSKSMKCLPLPQIKWAHMDFSMYSFYHNNTMDLIERIKSCYAKIIDNIKIYYIWVFLIS